ncbi:RhoGAP-domain-containing protein [Fistulina hepatica ATCC 64428]|uniref:RhoGAP-domain-containing protein n=1 Tax=Fistulina hepatica ATCC 64428 TaxID=1128425 RepID=A0A0D7A375_9AGAR|nr:RhoGAP-domain-containing protein [Fistulina hepatica ATCC 64428]
MEDRICPGCSRSALSETGGLVVAFGSSLFHVECFKCAKCGNQVTADTNLLLLSDGSPICANCSYNCFVCSQPILDEAIMTGDESYHAHCFRCKVCKSRIDELLFAKTSQGIYCMNCHNDRMIRIRKHAQRKNERETQRRNERDRAAAAAATASAGGSLSSKTYDRDANHAHANGNTSTKSESDVVRPLKQKSVIEGLDASSSNGLSSKLSVAESRRRKRGSINPGLTLSSNMFSAVPPSNGSLSPLSLTFRQSPPVNTESELTDSASPARGSRRSTLNGEDQTIVIHPPVRKDSINYKQQTLESPRISLNDRVHDDIADDPASPPVNNGTSSRSSSRQSPNQPLPTHSAARPTSPWSMRSRSRSPSLSRAPSPLRRVDVPRGVESESENEGEIHKDGESNEGFASHSSAGSSESESSSPIQDLDIHGASAVRTSYPTFITPALPPIRFSMNPGDFSELFAGAEASSVAPKAGAPLNLAALMTPIDEKFVSKEDSIVPATAGSADTAVQSIATVTEKKAGRERTAESNDADEPTQERESFAPRITISVTQPTNLSLRHDHADVVMTRLQEALADTNERGAQQLKLDRAFVEAILDVWESKKKEITDMKARLDGIRRTSKQYIDGLSVAQTEYDRELNSRRDAEAEVTRLRVLLSGQTVRLAALSSDTRRQEMRQQVTKEMDERLSGLQYDLSKLKVQRDMTLAEVEELAAASKSPDTPVDPQPLSRRMTMRLDNLKKEYQHQLVPLTQQKEAMVREIVELKAVRDLFLEETTALNARNEQLAQLSAQYSRKVDLSTGSDSRSSRRPESGPGSNVIPPLTPQKDVTPQRMLRSNSLKKRHAKPEHLISAPLSNASTKFGWARGNKMKEQPPPSSYSSKAAQHNFQELSTLRFTRCDHCGDKMWGSQLKCTLCNVAVHVRCVIHVQMPCNYSQNGREENPAPAPLPPSMFGRHLIEQVHADAKGGDRTVPVIVEKCIDAVEHNGMDYEGIYRKSGGASQNKAITQLFERGDYDTIDLRDEERFNDITSVTSVLKTYLRSLPVPLLTYDLHDQFMSAIQLKDAGSKAKTLSELVSKLPVEHYCTLRSLMMHLYRIQEKPEFNKMNARNLGVVFGPTLMRSSDPAAEFNDMAGKALTIEWLVENAHTVFSQGNQALRSNGH